MLYRFYEWWIARNLERIPRYLCFMISDEEMQSDPEKIHQVVDWSLAISSEVIRRYGNESGIISITIHISTKDTTSSLPYLETIRALANRAHLILHVGNTTEDLGTGIPIAVAVGKSGRAEIIDAIKQMANDSTNPDEVDEHKLERYLIFQHTPDFVIKTGGSHLVDFLIWQSVYSELFFLDLNWKELRKVDLIRAFRDYQSRVRRFGA
ncbi:MAG: undecaprenyl diphosphate synthase family protein [Methanospirillum sp.]|uniref:undecaprenyl diphosphate synthase family protein n=1 Tax=Methanospirillum sp. TaxID=45200 RepID=UPI00237475A3|nr:undecaprenyl diphosphate synthase family protein [Methanospirillum sp.]MDD1728545.1 undecaprenyl diphosphate synthase family protein [Methanospirillum sp.]